VHVHIARKIGRQRPLKSKLNFAIQQGALTEEVTLLRLGSEHVAVAWSKQGRESCSVGRFSESAECMRRKCGNLAESLVT
jgi:hypothetical protein